MINYAINTNESTIKKYIESLKSEDPEIREKLDYGYSYDGKVAIFYEIRSFTDDPKRDLKY